MSTSALARTEILPLPVLAEKPCTHMHAVVFLQMVFLQKCLDLFPGSRSSRCVLYTRQGGQIHACTQGLSRFGLEERQQEREASKGRRTWKRFSCFFPEKPLAKACPSSCWTDE